MIELRWVVGRDDANPVLQYRIKPPPVMEIIPQPWTEWQDVPTESESAAPESNSTKEKP